MDRLGHSEANERIECKDRIGHVETKERVGHVRNGWDMLRQTTG